MRYYGLRTMNRLRDNLSLYWPALVGVALYAPLVWRYVELAEWDRYARVMALATLGFVSAVAADEVASYTGRYGWTSESFWTYPSTWVRTAGVATLVGVHLFGFR